MIHVKDSRHAASSVQPRTASCDSLRPRFCSLLSWRLDNLTRRTSPLRFSDIYQREHSQLCWWAIPLGPVHYLDAASSHLGWRVDRIASGPLDEAKRQFVFLAKSSRGRIHVPGTSPARFPQHRPWLAPERSSCDSRTTAP